MNTHPVNPATITVWRWHAFAWIAIAIVAVSIVSAVEGRYLWPMAPVLFALIALSMCWFWPAAAYRHLRFGVDETGIVIESGVFFRSHIALPRVRIQHTDVTQGPVDRRFGLGTLVIYTAGTEHAAIPIEGLAHETALALRDALLARDVAAAPSPETGDAI